MLSDKIDDFYATIINPTELRTLMKNFKKTLIILATIFILFKLPTEVPPNFKTIIFIDILYLNFYI